jgi:hypothetical protein
MKPSRYDLLMAVNLGDDADTSGVLGDCVLTQCESADWPPPMISYFNG